MNRKISCELCPGANFADSLRPAVLNTPTVLAGADVNEKNTKRARGGPPRKHRGIMPTNRRQDRPAFCDHLPSAYLQAHSPSLLQSVTSAVPAPSTHPHAPLPRPVRTRRTTPRAVSAQLPCNPTSAPTYIASQASLLFHGPSAAPAPQSDSNAHLRGTSTCARLVLFCRRVIPRFCNPSRCVSAYNSPIELTI